ncbi:hypothetical protein RIF29_05920 [Crotalaria pallida]|uniref:Small VCP/p97-interacting protein n=1 Tax=Crotalaria pallida TaxID=3830 RepID=A0AAN9J2L3_CROPI
MGFLCFTCFNGGAKRMTKEEERLASEEARQRAAEAAQKRQEQFENSAAGRAARAQQQGMAKQAANANKGEPVLKGRSKDDNSALLVLREFYQWSQTDNGIFTRINSLRIH